MDELTLARLRLFKESMQPLMEEWKALSLDDQAAVLKNIIGAYINESEQLRGSLDEACNRAHRLFDAMLRRQERPVEPQ